MSFSVSLEMSFWKDDTRVEISLDKDSFDLGNISEKRICVLSNRDSEYCLIRGDILSEVSVVDLFNNSLISSMDSFLNSMNLDVKWCSNEVFMD